MRSAFSFASLQSGQEEKKTENWEMFNHNAGDKYQMMVLHKISHSSSGLFAKENTVISISYQLYRFPVYF